MPLTKDIEKEDQGKFVKASSVASNIKKFFLCFGIMIGLASLFYYGFAHQYFQKSHTYVEIIDETTGEILVTAEVEAGDEISFHWIHSVEHIPWIELFVVDQQKNLLLQEIRFQGFGAGIPHDKGKEVVVEDGFIIMKDIGEVYSSYNWIHSHTATEKIALNGEIIVEGKDLPHHGYMKMVIQER